MLKYRIATIDADLPILDEWNRLGYINYRKIPRNEKVSGDGRASQPDLSLALERQWGFSYSFNENQNP